jgi:hypothetical protein
VFMMNVGLLFLPQSQIFDYFKATVRMFLALTFALASHTSLMPLKNAFMVHRMEALV